jgi:putative transposase
MYLINSLEKARMKLNFDLWAYVIMPNHVHLVIFPKNNDYSIPEILNSIKLPAAERALHWMRVNKPEILSLFATGEKMQPYRFWLDAGGYDRNLRDQDELVKYVKYVHDNPVRKGLVENPTQWYWSSASDWLSDVKGPIRIDKDSFPVS